MTDPHTLTDEELAALQKQETPMSDDDVEEIADRRYFDGLTRADVNALFVHGEHVRLRMRPTAGVYESGLFPWVPLVPGDTDD